MRIKLESAYRWVNDDIDEHDHMSLVLDIVSLASFGREELSLYVIDSDEVARQLFELFETDVRIIRAGDADAIHIYQDEVTRLVPADQMEVVFQGQSFSAVNVLFNIDL